MNFIAAHLRLELRQPLHEEFLGIRRVAEPQRISESNSTSLPNTSATCCSEAASGARSTYSQPGSGIGPDHELEPLDQTVVARAVFQRFCQIRTKPAWLNAAQHRHAAGFHVNGAAADAVNGVAGVAVPGLQAKCTLALAAGRSN